MSSPAGADIVRLLVRYRQNGLEPLSPEETAAAARLGSAIRERFAAETSAAFHEAFDDFERQPARRQEGFRRLLDDLMRRDPAFANRLGLILATAAEHAPSAGYSPPPATVRRVDTVVISPSSGALPDGPAPLPPALADLCARLMAAFNLEEMKDLALNLGFIPDTIPSITLQANARGLILACWRAAKIDRLVAEATRLRPAADWAVSLAGLPPVPPPEFDHDDMPFVRQTILAETVKNIRSVFSDTRQVALVLAVALGVAALIYGVRWYRQQPERMTGEFNIAVAGIDMEAAGADSIYGPIISQQIASILNQELDSFSRDVQVSDHNMGVVNTYEDAERLADRANAHMVIYGKAEVFDDTVRHTPQFYVNDTAHAAMLEVNGTDFLEEAIPLDKDSLEQEPPDTAEIAARAALLTDFARALVYLAFEDLDAAAGEIESAMRRVETDEWLTGKPGYEVIYLYASQIARLGGRPEQAEAYVREALGRNEGYARGYIALGNLYYNRGDLAATRDAYLQAIALSQLQGEPEDDLTVAKASLGLGNIALQSLEQIVNRDCNGEDRGRAEEALSRYQVVIDSYEAAREPGELLGQLTGQAYAGVGIVHRACGRLDPAAEAFRVALTLPLPAPVATETRNSLVELEAIGD